MFYRPFRRLGGAPRLSELGDDGGKSLMSLICITDDNDVEGDGAYTLGASNVLGKGV